MENSELRQDLVSGDWVIIAPGRLRRPDQFLKKKVKQIVLSKKTCPFEGKKFLKRIEGKIILRWPETGPAKILIFPNDYPVLNHLVIPQKGKIVLKKEGPYNVVEGRGRHDLVVTNSHFKDFFELSLEEAIQVLVAFRDRYLMLAGNKNLAYVSIFHNWGTLAGASVYHPHYQIISLPVVPPDVSHSLAGSDRYFKEHHSCVHCAIIDWEKKEKKRIIAENKDAIAFAPFVSRNPFEVRVFLKKHQPYFENTPDGELRGVAIILRQVLHLLKKNLNGPDYNFFIHTSPLKNKRAYQHYHWHMEILPKFSIQAGFELGTGIEINVIDPDLAAKILRK